MFYYKDRDLIKKETLGKSGVYKITNLINSDCYIGSAISKTSKHNRLYIRFLNHFFHSHKTTNIYLRRAMEKHGKNNFSFEILEYTNCENTRDRETYHISHCKATYNFKATGSGTVNYKHTEITKLKMSQNYSVERKEMIGKLNKDKNLSETTKLKLSESAKTRWSCEKTRSDHSQLMKTIPNARSRESGIYCCETNKLLSSYPTLKALAIENNINYRTARRYIKSGNKYNKIYIIKYI